MPTPVLPAILLRMKQQGLRLRYKLVCDAAAQQDGANSKRPAGVDRGRRSWTQAAPHARSSSCTLRDSGRRPQSIVAEEPKPKMFLFLRIIFRKCGSVTLQYTGNGGSVTLQPIECKLWGSRSVADDVSLPLFVSLLIFCPLSLHSARGCSLNVVCWRGDMR